MVKKGSMIVPDPNMFGGSVFVSVTNLVVIGVNIKQTKMHLGKINIRTQVQEQMKLLLMQTIEVLVYQKWLIQFRKKKKTFM